MKKIIYLVSVTLTVFMFSACTQSATEESFEGDGRDFWVVDCSLMAENMMLAANAMGIGSCFTGVWPGTDRAELIRKHLNIPSKYEVLGMIPMGYPAENPDVKDKWRPEAVHYNAW